ncbi:ABC transporter ATP-binding protein [Candidatus Peregrinibacteria bacterium]|jgi:branched-chain amino acid transport system ATP-binding protein|nr:ABC transporter ATP-binding protein [Candidatus Peregrinibacteria bacterium]
MPPKKISPILNIKNLKVSFGAQPILQGVSLSVNPGEIVGIIGPNGCGKTTLLNSVSGFVSAQSGTVRIQEKNIAKMDAYMRARKYIGRSFQNVGVFKEMSLEENLMIVLEKEKKFPWWWMFSSKKKKEMDKLVNEALKEVGLLKYKKSLAGVLSGGQLRLLELARLKLSSKPVLLIDEPTAGVAPALRNQLAETIKKLSKDYGHTIVLVEHDLKFLFDIVTRVIVMVDGKVYMEGKPEKVQKDKKLQEVYFGK